MVNEFSAQEIKECFMEFTMKLSRLGLDRFSLSIKSRNVNLFVETSEKRDKTHLTRKRKSPSNLKRSHLRKQLFLRRKREQLASSLPVPQPEDVISSPGVISRPTLTPNSSNIMPCDSCDQSFLNSRNLSIHQAKMHDNKICQLDGQTDDMDDPKLGRPCPLSLPNLKDIKIDMWNNKELWFETAFGYKPPKKFCNN